MLTCASFALSMAEDLSDRAPVRPQTGPSFGKTFTIVFTHMMCNLLGYFCGDGALRYLMVKHHTFRGFTLAVALVSGIACGPARGLDCGAATTMAEMRSCVDSALAAETKAMDAAFAALQRSVSPIVFSRLREAQAAWGVWRDREAVFAASQAEGGTLAPLLAASAVLALTQARRAQLESALAEMD